MITVNIKYAFNNASLQLILEKLSWRGICEFLIKIMASYLSEREILLDVDGIVKHKRINGGVPEGSVFGPPLWNMEHTACMYDSYRCICPWERHLLDSTMI